MKDRKSFTILQSIAFWKMLDHENRLKMIVGGENRNVENSFVQLYEDSQGPMANTDGTGLTDELNDFWKKKIYKETFVEFFSFPKSRFLGFQFLTKNTNQRIENGRRCFVFRALNGAFQGRHVKHHWRRR